MRAYLAGPMTGIPHFNIPAFDDAAARLREEGWEVVSPAELDDPATRRQALASLDGKPGATEESWGDFLSRDIKIVADDVEAIVFLPGWENSRGARLEAYCGLLCGHRFYRYDSEVEGACYRIDPEDVRAVLVGSTAPGSELVTEWVTEQPPKQPVAELTGEVRVTNEKTGGQKGMKPERLELLPPEGLLEIARVYGFGAQKYEANNWRKGYAWSLSFGALLRHLMAFWSGEDNDPESGLSHLAHAGFHILGLLTFTAHPQYAEHDDRPGAVEHPSRRPGLRGTTEAERGVG